MLTEAEKFYLAKFKRSAKRIYINYLSVGILFAVALFGLYLGIFMDRREGFLMTIILGGFGFTLFIVTRSYKRLYAILIKMEECIKKLEK